MEIFIDETIKWFISVYESFYNSVIFENRYEMILDGLENTIILSFGALLIGITIGFLISIIRYTNNHTGKFKVLNFIGKTYITIIRGTPSVLQLMIIYYVIFKTSSINSIIIGMLAFGINSGAYCSEILRSGFDSVDDGQLEAGLALGLTFSQTLKSIIIPQAIRISLPSLGNEFVTLVKETAIAGYIGIMDLTKASDIIASRTYDYFFPLILIAIIYLIITGLLSKLMKTLERKLAR